MTAQAKQKSGRKGGSRSAPFELKGSMFTLTILQLRKTELTAIGEHLAEKISQAPDFFRNVPVIIDLDEIGNKANIDFSGLCDLLRNRGMIPVAVRNAVGEQQQAASQAGLPTLPEGRIAPTQERSNQRSNNKTASSSSPQPSQHRLHNQPVRSGQQLYVPNGDLILSASVSSGAEVLADGSIHIYGALRGRALAGVKGDTGARIFCQQLEAELVSIAGNYRLIEELDDDVRGKTAHIYLSEEQRLIIEPM